MSLLNNNKTPDKWKNKYFQLLDENEEREKDYQNKEELLCKTIIRLSLATAGLNKKLDPLLLHLRTQLKKGLNSTQLKSELDEFSDALMRLDDNEMPPELIDASLLFNFLYHQFPEHKKEILHIENKYENHGYTNSQYLIIAINDFIDSIQHIEAVTGNSVINELLDTHSIFQQLQLLLSETEIPGQFTRQAEQLKDKIITNADINTVLKDTIELLFAIKKHHHSEQQELVAFLGHLTEQLTELGNKATGVQSASETSTRKRNLLDESVSSQMLDLQNSSRDATQLEPLKQLIYTRLAEISQQIQQQKNLEAKERKKTHQALAYLSEKINKMEQESQLLHNKLQVAQQNALHDPLTGLPNRLAYDQRLEIELARFKRYKTPLSLLIWDIDFFKKINDTFGHKAGDKTLILISKLLSNHCRESDFICRFGGEEFVMLQGNTDIAAAEKSADHLRQLIENTAFNSSGKKISITVSCGITQFSAEDTVNSAFKRADKALYSAKKTGRNQCVVG